MVTTNSLLGDLPDTSGATHSLIIYCMTIIHSNNHVSHECFSVRPLCSQMNTFLMSVLTQDSEQQHVNR